MANFNDLEFNQHPNWPDGIQAKITFENGRGASVIRSIHSYGGFQGLYELAVLDKNGHLDYTTPLTSDVMGYLTEDDVTEALTAIEAME